MTEDADLALRLTRCGYRVTTITRPTFEDAPTDPGVWLRQRTRWYKGWMQTLLVHWRDPVALLRELGPLRFLASQILLIGNIFSALVHPMIVAVAGLMLWRWYSLASQTALDTGLLAIDTLNLFAAYLFFHILGLRASSRRERRAGPVLPWIPLYWLMLSVAAWRAAWQLFRAPHLWEKTPHRPASAQVAAARLRQSRKAGPEPMTLSSSSPMTAMSRPS